MNNNDLYVLGAFGAVFHELCTQHRLEYRLKGIKIHIFDISSTLKNYIFFFKWKSRILLHLCYSITFCDYSAEIRFYVQFPNICKGITIK